MKFTHIPRARLSAAESSARAVLRVVSCVLALLMLPSAARASGQDAALVAAITDLNQAKGPDAYTAARRVWAAWATADPGQVEQALLDASRSTSFTEPVRAYAGFLAAHARTRRGDPSGARRAVAELGYVDRWLVLGPFDNEGKGGFNVDAGPESQFNEAIDSGRAYTGKLRPVHWRSAPEAFSFGWVDGGALFRPQQNICFYAATTVWRDAPLLDGKAANRNTANAKSSIWVGAAGAFKLFVNGKLLLSDAAYRGHDVDRFGAVVSLPTGKSRLLVKVCGLEAAPMFSVRLAGASGAPDPQLRFSVENEGAELSIKNNDQLSVLRTDLGPIAEFERRTTLPKPDAAALEAYARYLVASSADDPALHRARDLAKLAAERAPTVPRLLLAGELAEDYNQHRQWVSRAEALAGGKPPIEVLLARAQVEQSGLNYRDAFPFYRQALQLDPDNVVALGGEVELLNEAGLGRSALARLKSAVERNPNSVTLLSSYAQQLRSLDFGVEAEFVEQRYAQFRFDDHTLLADRIQLALARGERAEAEHWVLRLLTTHPESLWAHSVAARAYRKLAQPERAVAAYKTALLLAPEDTSTLRALSDLLGELGQVDEQVALLRRVLEIQPQAKEIQEYLRNIEPQKPKQDEALAWDAERFLKGRSAPANGESKRTLLDLSVTTVFDNGLSSQFRQVVFQPLVESAATLSQSYVFGYEADSQSVQLRGARVFRADGRIDESVQTAIGAANDPSIAMYTSGRAFNVQFPRLEPGDVVELRYRIDDVAQRNVFNDYFGDIKYLQDTDSVGHAEYVLITPKSRQIYVDSQRIPGLKSSVQDKGSQRVMRFWAEDLAPVLPEPAMPPWQEVLGFVHVSTYRDYAQLGKWYWGLAQDQFDLDDETRKLARDITQGLTTDRQKVEAVYDWVIRNTRYVALEFGIYGFKPRRCVQTVARGWGDCKDKATVIVTLLRELGIDSTIVVLRTQMRGMFESSVASLAPFDHAIAYVPSLDLYLDGTAEFTGIDELPDMDQQALGLLINQGDTKLARLPLLPAEQSVRSRRVTAHIEPGGAARLELNLQVKGTAAPQWRRRYHADSARRERAESDLTREFPGFKLDLGEQGLKAELDDYRKPVQISIQGTTPAYGRQEGDRFSYAVTTALRLTGEYASLSKRTLPVAVPILGRVEDTFSIQLPKGYRVYGEPQDQLVKTRFGDYSVSVEQGAGSVTVTSSILLRVTRVEPKDYPAWRAFCQAVDAAMTPRLVIGK